MLDHKCVPWELCDSIKCNNICIIGVPEKEGGGKAEGLFEQIISANFPDLGKETGIQIQEAQRTSININKSQPKSGCIAVKFAKYTEKERKQGKSNP